MAEIAIFYEENLSTRTIQEESSSTTRVETYDRCSQGKWGEGRFFSPTDLVGIALGSCALTLMGIAAKTLQIDLAGLRVVVSKEMQATPPRRVKKIRLEFFCPHAFSEGTIHSLVKAAEQCPVHQSLHPDIVQEFIYHWGRG